MDVKFQKLVLMLSVCLLSVTEAYAQAMSLADSLMAETSFTIRGEISKTWRNRGVKFAVTDPVKNKLHDIVHDGGRFEMTVPMRGYVQDIFLYIDGTVTIPVCAGDTFNLIIGEDDMWLSAQDKDQHLDLQLALAVHRKMRGIYMEINSKYNEFFKAMGQNRCTQATLDSLYNDVAHRIVKYQERFKTVVDTFVARHGSPRNLIIDTHLTDRCYTELAYPTYVLIDPEGRIVEFATDRPSSILQASRRGQRTVFEKVLRESVVDVPGLMQE